MQNLFSSFVPLRVHLNPVALWTHPSPFLFVVSSQCPPIFWIILLETKNRTLGCVEWRITKRTKPPNWMLTSHHCYNRYYNYWECFIVSVGLYKKGTLSLIAIGKRHMLPKADAKLAFIFCTISCSSQPCRLPLWTHPNPFLFVMSSQCFPTFWIILLETKSRTLGGMKGNKKELKPPNCMLTSFTIVTTTIFNVLLSLWGYNLDLFWSTKKRRSYLL